MSSQTSRRGFLGAGATALAGIGSASGIALAADQKNDDLKLGVASYSLREFSRRMAISMTRQLGIRYINIKEFHLPYRSTPEELARGRKEFEASGLTITGGGTINLQKDDDSDIRFYFEYAKACGMPMMVIAPTQRTMPRIERFVKEYDIMVAVHNHGPEDKYFPAPKDALKVIKDMDPRVGVCIDVGHTTRTGADVVESIAEAGPRLLDMHIKDLRNLMDKNSQCEVGDGAMPVVAIFKQLKKMNYQGHIMLEYEIKPDNPFPGMEKSFAYMKGVLAGLRG
ncbi:MAG: sugar phosphate isomerase/epimerase family protein [Bryobacteraceae bacterium]